MNRLLSFFLILLSSQTLFAQELEKRNCTTDSLFLFSSPADSITHIVLPDVVIFPSKNKRKNLRYYQRYRKRYSRLEHKVKKVYPYAKLAGVKLQKYNKEYLNYTTERSRKQYAKSIEKEIRSEFELEIRKMKISEGRILIKLIDREAGINSYEIIKEFRGGFQAFLWQTVATVFGHNLKSEYDAIEEDKMIEDIIQKIESSQKQR